MFWMFASRLWPSSNNEVEMTEVSSALIILWLEMFGISLLKVVIMKQNLISELVSSSLVTEPFQDESYQGKKKLKIT